MDNTTIPVREKVEHSGGVATTKVPTKLLTPEFIVHFSPSKSLTRLSSPEIPFGISKKEASISSLTREVPIEIFTEETSTDLLNPDVGDSSRFSREKIKENLVLIGRKLVVLAFSYVGLTCMVICYSLLGAVIFTALESLNEKSMVLQITQERQNRLKELWNITKHFNIFSEEDWIKKATGVIKEFEHSIYVATSELGWDGHTEEAIGELNWSFTGSLLYCVTVITTIGYGHITPKTWAGRLITIIYALIGIPLTLLCLANIGKIWSKGFKLLYSKILPINKQPLSRTLTKQDHTHERKKECCDDIGGTKENGHLMNSEHSNIGLNCKLISQERKNYNEKRTVIGHEHSVEKGHGDVINQDLSGNMHEGQGSNNHEHEKKTKEITNVQVPIFVCILLVTVYILIGVLIFTFWERKWNILTSAYFCFITLSTIGFGDFVPGHSIESWSNQPKQIVCTLYLLFGLALLAMCFDLIQDQARVLARRVGVLIKLLKQET